MARGALIAAIVALTCAAPATAQVRGGDAAACTARTSPAIEVHVTGLKDRTGSLKLELYPATQADFLKDDRDLIAQHKFFRRIRIATPASGPVTLCIRAPRAGRYALLLTHDRDGRNKFNFWTDGAGFPSNGKLGRTRPTLDQAAITVGRGVSVVTIRTQYLRGIGGFGPVRR